MVTTSDELAERVFSIPAATAEVTTDASSLTYIALFARMLAASCTALPDLLRAYREGGGVSWEHLGEDTPESQADSNRPWYDVRLGPAQGRPVMTTLQLRLGTTSELPTKPWSEHGDSFTCAKAISRRPSRLVRACPGWWP